MNLTHTDPRFQSKIRAIGIACSMPTEEVYQLWRDYTRQCTDQSAILSEFIEWYADRLGVNKYDLLTLIED